MAALTAAFPTQHLYTHESPQHTNSQKSRKSEELETDPLSQLVYGNAGSLLPPWHGDADREQSQWHTGGLHACPSTRLAHRKCWSAPRSGEDSSVFSVSAMAIATMFPKVSGTALSTCCVVRALAKP